MSFKELGCFIKVLEFVYRYLFIYSFYPFNIWRVYTYFPHLFLILPVFVLFILVRVLSILLMFSEYRLLISLMVSKLFCFVSDFIDFCSYLFLFPSFCLHWIYFTLLFLSRWKLILFI